MGTLEAIWTTPEGSAPMESVDRVEAVADRGLRGDRYFRGTGYYSGFDGCEVTLVAAEALATVREAFGIDLSDGRHRRNLVVRGVDLATLLEARFDLGGAVFEGTRPRPPCAHVEDVADEKGVSQALGADRGGICARVVESGSLAVGDEVGAPEPVGTDPDALADAIRERHG